MEARKVELRAYHGFCKGVQGADTGWGGGGYRDNWGGGPSRPREGSIREIQDQTLYGLFKKKIELLFLLSFGAWISYKYYHKKMVSVPL